MRFEKSTKSLIPLQRVGILLAIDDLAELADEELEKLNAKQWDLITVAETTFENDVGISLVLMSGTTNYWLEWLAYEHGIPLGFMFEPEYELEYENTLELNNDEYVIRIKDGF